MLRRWFRWIINLFYTQVTSGNSVDIFDGDSISSGNDAIIWNREYFFRYFVMDNVLTYVTCIVLSTVLVGYVITSYFRKQSTLAWKLCRFKSHLKLVGKQNNELSRQLVRAKSQLTLAEQKLAEKGSAVANILEISRLRSELESVRNERNELLRRLQSNSGKPTDQLSENDGAEFYWEQEANRLEMELKEYKITALKWEQEAKSLKMKLKEYEMSTNTTKRELEKGKKALQAYDNLIRERNSMSRRFEIVMSEKREATMRVLTLQSEMKAMEEQLEELKEELSEADNAVANLKKEVLIETKEKMSVMKQLDISQQEVKLLNTTLNKIAIDRESCHNNLLKVERELWKRKLKAPPTQATSVQVFQDRNNLINVNNLDTLIEEDTSHVKKELLNSLEEHLSWNTLTRKRSETSIVPTHDSDVEDLLVSKDDDGGERITKENTEKLAEEKHNDKITVKKDSIKKFPDEKVTVSKAPNQMKKEQLNLVVTPSVLQTLPPRSNTLPPGNAETGYSEISRFQRTLRTLELLERSVDMNLLKRKSSMGFTSNISSNQDDDTSQNISNTNIPHAITELYHGFSLTDEQSGLSIGSSKNTLPINVCENKIIINLIDQIDKSKLLSKLKYNENDENFLEFPENNTTLKSVCNLGSKCSVCSRESCLLNPLQDFSKSFICAQCCQSAARLEEKQLPKRVIERPKSLSMNKTDWISGEETKAVADKHVNEANQEEEEDDDDEEEVEEDEDDVVGEEDEDEDEDEEEEKDVSHKSEPFSDSPEVEDSDNGDEDTYNQRYEENESIVDEEVEIEEEEEDENDEEENESYVDTSGGEENEVKEERRRIPELSHISEEGESFDEGRPRNESSEEDTTGSSLSESSSSPSVSAVRPKKDFGQKLTGTKNINRRPVSGSPAFQKFMETYKSWGSLTDIRSN